MSQKKNIGSLIEDEVRRLQIPIVDFAKKINCQRNNVYNIFRRDTIDIIKLKEICRVLNRNFFQEIADNLDLVGNCEETENEKLKQKAVSQFFAVVPNLLSKMNKSCTIVFCQLTNPVYKDCVTPDFGLSPYFITFTIGDTFKERMGDKSLLPVAIVYGHNHCQVEVIRNVAYNSVCVNIKLDYKTEAEWYHTLMLAFDTYARFS